MLAIIPEHHPSSTARPALIDFPFPRTLVSRLSITHEPRPYIRKVSPAPTPQCQFTILAYTKICPFSSRFSASSALTKRNRAHRLRRLDSFAAGEVSERMLTNLKSELRGAPILGGACALPRPRAAARASRGLRGACTFSFCATAHMHTVGAGGVFYLFAPLRFRSEIIAQHLFWF